MSGQTAETLYFVGERQVEVRREELGPPGPGMALLATECSGISAGSELLIYTNQMSETPGDETIDRVSRSLDYPLRYGYCSVGRVLAVGADVSPELLGRRAFAFVPHSSHFLVAVEDLLPVPEDISPEDAIFLANTETAVNLVLDGAPSLGGQVAVLGLGVVGLLTTALLAEFPLEKLVVFDRLAQRREAGRAAGATWCCDPGDDEAIAHAKATLAGEHYQGADLVFELSGSPAALNLALDLAGFHGRVVVGSWYGKRQASLDLGGRFHRQRIQIVSSQVSTIAPEHRGRWNKSRRFEEVWRWIRKLRPSRLITHRFELGQAERAYALLDTDPGAVLQVVFEYPQAGA